MSAHRRFLELRRRHAQEAWLAHVSDPARERVVAIMAEWLVGAIDLLPSSIPGYGMADVAAPVRIGDRLRDQGFGALAVSLEALLSTGRAETEPAPLRAGMALGEALAHAVAARPTEPLLRLAHWVLGLNGALQVPYDAALTELAQADPRVRFAVRRLLRERVRTFNRDPQRVALCASQAPMARWIDARAETGDDLRGLWDGGAGHDEFRMHDSLHFDWIRRLDARAFMALLHRFAIPGPVANLLKAMSWQKNLGDLASLLRQAPPVMVQTEGRVVAGVSTVLLLGTAARKLQERTRETDDGQPLSWLPCAAASETEDAIKALVGAVFSRRDGPGLARLWLCRLLNEDTASNVWNLPLLPLPAPSPEHQGRSIVGALVQALASRLPYPASADDELRTADALQRWPCLLASIATAVLSTDAAEVRSSSALLASLIQLDLIQTVVLDRFLASPDGIAADIVRHALRSEPDPSTWFEALWSSKAVALSRERRWRGDDAQAGYDACNAALVAVAVGVIAASRFARPTEAQQSLFTTVNAAVAGQLLAPTRSDPGLGWHKARRTCMALWPRLFAGHDEAQRSRLLADLLRPFVRPTETFAWDLVELARAGVSAEAIGSALRSLGHAPVTLIDIILFDKARRGDGSRVTWHEARILESLRSALAGG